MKKKKFKILAVTLARGGSKGIKNKNIIKILGKPLIEYTIDQALKSKLITHYLVSTDSKKIQKLVNKRGNYAPFKAKKLSQSKSKAVDADKHALKWAEKHFQIKFDYFVELMVTNLKTHKDIDNVLTKLLKQMQIV